MELSSNQKIIEKVEEIVQFLQEGEEYQTYLQLRKKMEDHPKIPSLIAEIKKIQKELVQKTMRKEDTKQERDKIIELEKELEAIPLYVDFLQVQQELNTIFVSLHDRIESLFQF